MIGSWQCLVCNDVLPSQILDLGLQPPCNRFTIAANPTTDVYPLNVGRCNNCRLIQLTKLPPISSLIPRFSWVRYNEPEGHLDAVVGALNSHLQGVGTVVFGMGPFNAPLFSRLNNIECLDLLSYISPQRENEFPYLESMQAKINFVEIETLKQNHGQCDLLIFRYLLEHCHDPVMALKSMKGLLKVDGMILVEVPDCTKFISRLDYSFIWEEHTTYFTKTTLTNLVTHCGYEVIDVQQYDGQLEDALVFLIKPKQTESKEEYRSESPAFISAYNKYLSSYADVGKYYRQTLSEITARGKKIVVFGAGHQAVMFINALNLAPYISCVIDDDVNKQDKLLPGSNLPIVPSSTLLTDDSIEMCLLAVSPKVEIILRNKFAEFMQNGGSMYSISRNIQAESEIGRPHAFN